MTPFYFKYTKQKSSFQTSKSCKDILFQECREIPLKRKAGLQHNVNEIKSSPAPFSFQYTQNHAKQALSDENPEWEKGIIYNRVQPHCSKLLIWHLMKFPSIVIFLTIKTSTAKKLNFLLWTVPFNHQSWYIEWKIYRTSTIQSLNLPLQAHASAISLHLEGKHFVQGWIRDLERGSQIRTLHVAHVVEHVNMCLLHNFFFQGAGQDVFKVMHSV